MGFGIGSALPGTSAMNSTNRTNAASIKRKNQRRPRRKKRTFKTPAIPPPATGLPQTLA
jgi:hypothetical protein